MAILRRELVKQASPEPAPERLVHVVAKLCEREGLEPAEAEGVLCVALTWPPDRPHDPEPLLHLYRMPD